LHKIFSRIGIFSFHFSDQENGNLELEKLLFKWDKTKKILPPFENQPELDPMHQQRPSSFRKERVSGSRR
jgi:hypothetical protein